MEQQVRPSTATAVTGSSRAGHPWLASSLLQRQVVNVTTLEPIGRISDVYFDPQRSQIVGVSVQAQTAPGGFVSAISRALGRGAGVSQIALEHVVSLNGDVVMVDADPARSLPAFQGMSQLNEVCELVILTTYGMSLGSLADLLLDVRGTTVMGYVVKPTELATSILPSLEDLEQPGQRAAAAPETAETPSAQSLPSPRLRVIPAESRVRFGDSLILYVAEVEPLERKVVVITPQNGDRTEPRTVSR
ncbi:MAG TPA: hypothetical protein VF812_08890 [Ktedonobacterales bacterium]